ncbi:unnamed protein product [Rhizophagus irregularis]|nr:unnamed protein product [Rhizophagus irregularis]
MASITEFVKRPGLGRLGRPVRVRANFFEVTALPDANIHHYDIDISPEVPPAMNRKIYKHFEALHSEKDLGKIKPVYDGRKNLYTAKPLPFGESAAFDVTLPEDDGTPSELHRFLEGKGSISPNILTGIMALDILIRHKPSMEHATVGRSFFTKQGSRPLNALRPFMKVVV